MALPSGAAMPGTGCLCHVLVGPCPPGSRRGQRTSAQRGGSAVGRTSAAMARRFLPTAANIGRWRNSNRCRGRPDRRTGSSGPPERSVNKRKISETGCTIWNGKPIRSGRVRQRSAGNRHPLADCDPREAAVGRSKGLLEEGSQAKTCSWGKCAVERGAMLSTTGAEDALTIAKITSKGQTTIPQHVCAAYMSQQAV